MPEQQILKIEPENELKFKGPFTSPTTTVLKLGNPSERKVCFKIKTTAPKRYCVRPNAGILDPGQTINIAVVFQPCELEPTATKHKFMVQSIYAPDGDFNLETLWKEMDPTKLMDSKLRCAFESGGPNDGVVQQNDLNAQEDRGHSRSQPDTEERHRAKAQKVVYEERRGGDSNRNTDSVPLKEREEIQELKREIIKLKAMNTRSGHSYDRQTSATSPPAIPMIYMVVGIACIIFGLILGKFIV